MSCFSMFARCLKLKPSPRLNYPTEVVAAAVDRLDLLALLPTAVVLVYVPYYSVLLLYVVVVVVGMLCLL